MRLIDGCRPCRIPCLGFGGLSRREDCAFTLAAHDLSRENARLVRDLARTGKFLMDVFAVLEHLPVQLDCEKCLEARALVLEGLRRALAIYEEGGAKNGESKGSAGGEGKGCD